MKNLKSKLTSRKFWVAIVGVVGAVLVLLNVDQLTSEKIIALVSAEGTLVAYILTEGSIDKKAVINNEYDT